MKKEEVKQSFCGRMPFLSSTSRNHSLDLIFSLTTKTLEQGMGITPFTSALRRQYPYVIVIHRWWQIVFQDKLTLQAVIVQSAVSNQSFVISCSQWIVCKPIRSGIFSNTVSFACHFGYLFVLMCVHCHLRVLLLSILSVPIVKALGLFSVIWNCLSTQVGSCLPAKSMALVGGVWQPDKYDWQPALISCVCH